MTRHIDDSTLNELQDGLLDPAAEAEIRAHLQACPECREELEALSGLLEDLRELPVEAQPARDLWPQIAWRMEGVSVGSRTEELPARRWDGAPGHASAPTRGRGRRVTLPAWQLLAAGIALMVISSASVWTILSNRGRSEDSASVPPVPAQFAGWEDASGGYDEAVSDLEAVLDQGRDILGPETVRVLEENLRINDRAIEEAREALSEDPASTVLQRFLADNMRKKVDLLRQAAGAVLATT